ncbi:5-deoxy-glucuronate isomerase [Ruficoccus sp. ZRK36]|uniref:5-deoxy-glucuronate isomerase n=1 Tax=Ruficoccus sp. ZRK36 TaxID=2866311 RepID=UPI001C736A0B|nr:5-deoxy-glucuronate isomerase [Ruficoccus sp. ZRK36]QYY34335.1 5-deoxy-glucuronate isomerase [Ruficoccus sp. ZRK36]
MTHLIKTPAADGFNRIFDIGEKGMAMTGFGLLKLAPGEDWSVNSGEKELVLVVLGGTCNAEAGGKDFGVIGARKDVFSGDPYTLYIPPQCEVKLTGQSAVEVAIAESPCDKSGEPVLYTADDVKDTYMKLGKDGCQREAVIMIGDDAPAQHLFVGEAWVPSANWASYPPHRHDFHNPPGELDMEELYFYRFNPSTGFGLQLIYTDDTSTDVAYPVRENDTIVIPEGYHPTVNTPGYTMYYLWVMAGHERGFKRYEDPVHAARMQ